jgi:hypothetical protein
MSNPISSPTAFREASRPSPSRRLDRLGLLFLALTAVAYFWFIHNYGVNMLQADQWFEIRLLNHQYTGTLTLPVLWAQHGENRIFVQNLLVLILAHLTSFNVVIEEYLSGLMLVAASLLLILAHRRRAPSTPFLYYVPVALLMLSFVQSENTFFGFQIGWYVIVLALAAVIYLLDAPRITLLVLAFAVAMAVVGSLSSIQGLLIWPTGVFLLYRRERSRGTILTWTIAAIVTGVLYFYHYSLSSGGGSYSHVLTHPAEAARFFLVAIGDVIGFQISDPPGASSYMAMALGIVLLITACWILVAQGPRQAGGGNSAAGVALIVFGLLYAGSLTFGRIGFGFNHAGLSAYTTYTLLIPVGCYLSLLGQRERFREELALLMPRLDQKSWRQAAEPPRRGRGAASLAVCGALAVVICFQVVSGTASGVTNARAGRAFELTGARILANINRTPDALVERFLAAGGYESATFIRRMASVAEVHHLSLFDTSMVAAARRRGGISLGHSMPSTRLVRPTVGQPLAGSQYLYASASDVYGVTRVQFEVTGTSSTSSATIVPAVKFRYGWFGVWDTRSVPDGIYTLRSVVYNSQGDRAVSTPVSVEVRN